jgi:O-antigen/teichoic acid export membrane protein
MASLKSRVFRASGWTVVGHFASLLLRLLSSVVLTRLLTPDLFGILAVVTAVQVLISLLTDIGVQQAVIQSPRAESISFLNTAWTIQVLRGIALFTIGSLIAVVLYINRIYDVLALGPTYTNVQLPALIAVSSLSSVIMGFQSLKYALATRALLVGRIIATDLIAQIGSLVVVIIIAVQFRSVWAFVIGNLFNALLLVFLSRIWFEGPLDRFRLNREALAELNRFGRWVFLSSAIGAFGQNGDKFLLAGFLTPGELGYFSVASNLAAVPDGILNRILRAISLPAMSEVVRSQRERLREVYWRMRVIVDLAAVGSAGFLFSTGQFIVDVIYDSRYASAGRMLQLLSASLIFLRCGLSQDAYLALGKTQYIPILSALKLVSLAIMVPSFYLIFGLNGAVFGIAIHMLPCALYNIAINRRFNLNRIGLELLLLIAWPIGWSLGEVLLSLIGQFDKHL